MPLARNLENALVAVADVLRDARDPWWVIASAAAALHGADPGVVGDVDVLLGEDDARAILPALGLAVAAGGASDRFTSTIVARWHGTAMPVEFIADFCLREHGRWTPIVPRTRRWITVRGAPIPVPDRDELKAMFERFGRPKDIARARSLQ